MNIFKIDYEEIQSYITNYVLKHNDVAQLNGKGTFFKNLPIIFMNSETLSILKANNPFYIKIDNFKNKMVPTIFGCNIVIAEWLNFGEIQLGEIDDEI